MFYFYIPPLMNSELCDMGTSGSQKFLSSQMQPLPPSQWTSQFYPFKIYTTAMNSSPHARLGEASVTKNQTR